MATTVAQHSVATFTSPVNGTTPIDANTVRGNDNTIRTAYNDHDSDPGIHVQSSTLASRPVAGTAGRKWITTDAGSQKLWYDDGTDWHEVGGDSINIYCKATETLAKGDVVKITGYNTGQNVPEVAKVASATDVAFGICETAIANGSLGYVINTGIITDLNTVAFSLGNILYPNTSGWLTATKPTSGNYQTVAYVLRAHASQGTLYVEFSAPRIVERSDNTASTVVLRDASGNFSAGTVTVTQLDATTVNATTFDMTNLEVTNIKAKDGTASATIADSTGVMTITSSVLTTTDINGGTIDGTTIGGSSAAAGTFTTVAATTGNITTVNATTVDATNVEVTNLKAKDGTSAATIADSTGVVTFTSTVSGSITGNAGTATALQTARTINGVSFDGTANITVAAAAGTLTGTTLASNVVSSSLTSVGTLSSLTVSGDLTVDTSTLKVDSSNNRVGIGTASPVTALQANKSSQTPGDAIPSGALLVTNSAAGNGCIEIGSGASTLGWIQVRNSTTAAFYDLAINPNGGNVGIGTASPGYQFDVRGSSPDIVAFHNGANGSRVGITATNTAAYIGTTYSTNDIPLIFTRAGIGSSGSELMRLDGGGNLGLGVTPSGNYTLQTQDNVSSGFKGFRLGGFRGGASGTGYPWVGYNIRPTSSSDAYNYDAGDVASAIRFADGIRFYTAPSGTAGNAISFTQAMTLDASGRLGIGTTSQTSVLHVVSSTNSAWAAQVYNNGSTDAHGLFVYTGASSTGIPFRVDAKGVEAARITSGGYTKASNDGTYISSTGAYHEIRSSDAGEPSVAIQSTNASYTGTVTLIRASKAAGTTFNLLNAQSNLVDQFTVRGDGTVYAQNTTIQAISDGRLKENIVDSTEGLGVITALRPVRYDWKPGHGNDRTHQLGFIAQEMEAVFPDAVSEWVMGSETYKTVGPAALIPVLVKAIQELTARVVALETN